MDKRDSEWISPDKFWGSQDRPELKRYWESEEGQKMKQQLQSVEMQRQPPTSYLPNQREDEKAPMTRLSAKEYYSTPEGKRRKELKRLDAEAHRPKDLTPRLSTKTPTQPEEPVTTRTLGSQYPPCTECGSEYTSPQGRKRNGFCGERCRKRAFRRKADERLAFSMQNIENAGVELTLKLSGKKLWPRQSTK